MKAEPGSDNVGGLDNNYVPDHAAICKDKPNAHVIFSTDVNRSGLCVQEHSSWSIEVSLTERA